MDNKAARNAVNKIVPTRNIISDFTSDGEIIVNKFVSNILV